MAPQAKGLLWLALAALAALGAAAGLPRLAGLVPWSWESRASAWTGAGGTESCGKDRPEAAALLARVASRLYPVYPDDRAFPLTVEVVRGSEVNAFAGLGGHVYVYDGLLQQAQSPEELAGVLAHEIEHVRRRHILQGLIARVITVGALRVVLSGGGGAGAQTASMLAGMSFTKQEEREADDGALERLAAARIDAAGFVSFFERLKKQPSLPSILSDHPSSDSRAERARRYLGRPSEPLLERKEWEVLKTICR